MPENDAKDDFRRRYQHSVVGLLGVELVEYSEDGLTAMMEVGELALNSQGVLHGGISPLIAETLSSFASLFPRRGTSGVAGLSVFSNHLEKGRRGDRLTFFARPLRNEGRLHVWAVEMRNTAGVLLSTSQVTVAVVAQHAPQSGDSQ